MTNFAKKVLFTGYDKCSMEFNEKLKRKIMLKEKAGVLAGQIWEALNGTEGMTQKNLKKAAKIRADKDLFLAIGWLLREDKIETSEVKEELFVKLK